MSSTLVKELFFVELITVSLVSKGTRPPSEEVLLRSVLVFFFFLEHSVSCLMFTKKYL